MCGGTAPHHHGHPQWVKVELFLVVLQDALRNGMKGVSALKVEGVRGRLHSLHGTSKQGVGRHSREGSETNKKEVEEKGLKVSITEGGSGLEDENEAAGSKNRRSEGKSAT